MADKSGPARRKGLRGSLSIDEINRRFEGEWVLVHVTGFDKRRVANRGRVLFHSPDQDEVDRAIPPAGDPRRPLRIFLAEPRPPFGPEDVTALEEMVARINAQLEADRGGVA